MKKLATIGAAGSPEEKLDFRVKDRSQPLSDKALLSLHCRLQGTLSLGKLIGSFYAWLGEQFPVAGIEYTYPEEQIKLSVGESRQHTARYVLRLEQRYLGEILLSSQQRMSDQHQYVQEQAIGVLVLCIQNALDYLALEKVAFHDSLTGVMNRTALDELLQKEVDRAQRYEYELSVAMVDIDHFKSINDRIGHLGADDVLRGVADAIKAKLRNSDLTFRYGGDEFLIVLPGTNLEGARIAVSQIMTALAKGSIDAGEHKITPELSIGVASCQVGEGSDDLLQRADNALYQAKQKGRNCVCS